MLRLRGRDFLREDDDLILADLLFPVLALEHEDRPVPLAEIDLHSDIVFVPYSVDGDNFASKEPGSRLVVPGEAFEDRAFDGVNSTQQPRRQGPSEKSIRNVRATLRTVLAFAVRWGYLSHLPDLPEVVVPEGSFDWYQPHEAARLVEAARDAWERALLLFPLTPAFAWASSGRCDGRMSTSSSLGSTSGDRRPRVSTRSRHRRATGSAGGPDTELAAVLRTIRHRAD